MDKETLSNYGWIVICVLVLAVMLALATPFGTFVSDAIKSTTQGLFDVNQNALNSTGLINIDGQEFESCPHDYETVTTGDCATGTTSTHTCKLCGKTSTETLPAGHTWDNTGLKCTKCGVTVVEYAFKASDYDAKMGTTTRTDAVVVIPETFEYNGKTYKVTSIGQSGFSNCNNLTGIIIPSSVTIINDKAFYGCYGLTSIVIPNCITEIGDEVFYYCKNLTKVVIPNSVTKMGNVVFGYCTSLKSVGPTGSNASVEIPYSITHLGDHTFHECSNIESAVIPYLSLIHI